MVKSKIKGVLIGDLPNIYRVIKTYGFNKQDYIIIDFRDHNGVIPRLQGIDQTAPVVIVGDISNIYQYRAYQFIQHRFENIKNLSDLVVEKFIKESYPQKIKMIEGSCSETGIWGAKRCFNFSEEKCIDCWDDKVDKYKRLQKKQKDYN